MYNAGAQQKPASGRPSSQAQGGQQGGGGGGGKSAPIPLRPVTIRMITTAQRVGEGAMLISGQEAGLVCVTGRVIEAIVPSSEQTQAKSHTYRVSDGTGIITVRHWLDQANAENIQPVGTFISATGTVKVVADKPVLTGTIRVAPDGNELLFHFLDSINVHLRITQPNDVRLPAGGKTRAEATAGMTPKAAAPQTAPYGNNNNNAYGNTNNNSAYGNNAAGHYQQPQMAASHQFGGAAASGAEATKTLESAIHRTMMGHSSREIGLSAAEMHAKIVQQLPNVTVQDIQAELGRLIDGGFYFPAKDGRVSY